VTDVLINTHYLPEKINDFIKKYLAGDWGINVATVHEDELLGSAGTLLENQDFFSGEEEFLILYGDNFTNINYENLLNFHRAKRALATIAVYREEHPETKGIVYLDNENKIVNFIEKPRMENQTSNNANAGIYVLGSGIFPFLETMEEVPLDFGHHLFPHLLKENQLLYAYEMPEYFIDIGTPESLEKANLMAKNLKF